MDTSSDHGPCSDSTCESTAVTLEWDKMCYVQADSVIIL